MIIFKKIRYQLEIYSDSIENIFIDHFTDERIIEKINMTDITSIITNNYEYDDNQLKIKSFYFVNEIDNNQYDEIEFTFNLPMNEIGLLYISPFFDHYNIKTDYYDKFSINIKSVNFNNYVKKFEKLKRGDIISLELINSDNDYNGGRYIFSKVDNVFLYGHVLDTEHFNYTPFMINLYRISKVNYIGMKNDQDIMEKYKTLDSDFSLDYFADKYVNILLVNYEKVIPYYISKVDSNMLECHYYNNYCSETSQSMFIITDHIVAMSLDYESNIMEFNHNKNKSICIIRNPALI